MLKSLNFCRLSRSLLIEKNLAFTNCTMYIKENFPGTSENVYRKLYCQNLASHLCFLVSILQFLKFIHYAVLYRVQCTQCTVVRKQIYTSNN